MPTGSGRQYRCQALSQPAPSHSSSSSPWSSSPCLHAQHSMRDTCTEPSALVVLAGGAALLELELDCEVPASPVAGDEEFDRGCGCGYVAPAVAPARRAMGSEADADIASYGKSCLRSASCCRETRTCYRTRSSAWTAWCTLASRYLRFWMELDMGDCSACPGFAPSFRLP